MIDKRERSRLGLALHIAARQARHNGRANGLHVAIFESLGDSMPLLRGKDGLDHDALAEIHEGLAAGIAGYREALALCDESGLAFPVIRQRLQDLVRLLVDNWEIVLRVVLTIILVLI